MKNSFFNHTVLLLLILGLTLSACKKKESPKPGPANVEALFTYVADGLTVTFTNQSTGADTYVWDFGDGQTSTEKNPVHTYDSKGTYTVKLTAKASDGTTDDISTSLTVDKNSPVVLDDNSFDDWANVADALTSYSDSTTGSVKQFKYDFDSENIYFYIKQEKSFTDASIFDMMIDLDPDNTSGYTYTLWPLFGGAELLIENSFATDHNDPDLYWLDFANFDSTGTDWDTFWMYDAGATADAQTDGTYKVSGNTVEIEFSISRTKIPALVGKDKIKIVAWTSDQDWNEIGWIPGKATPSMPDADGLLIDMQ